MTKNEKLNELELIKQKQKQAWEAKHQEKIIKILEAYKSQDTTYDTLFSFIGYNLHEGFHDDYEGFHDDIFPYNLYIDCVKELTSDYDGILTEEELRNVCSIIDHNSSIRKEEVRRLKLNRFQLFWEDFKRRTND